jgi:hypothetical protein
MSLEIWASNGWFKKHNTSSEEIANLFGIVNRDILDAGEENISADWQFGIAYNAALKLCTILLYASGYRPEKNLAHYRTLLALPMILGVKHKPNASYLDTCRIKRNTVEYDYIGGVSSVEAQELLMFVKDLHIETIEFLENNYPDLLSQLRQ